MMRRVLFLSSLVLWFCSCNNSGNTTTATDSPATDAAVATDTNNASRNTGVDMSGGTNSGNFNEGDTTGIDISTGTDTTGSRTRQ